MLKSEDFVDFGMSGQEEPSGLRRSERIRTAKSAESRSLQAQTTVDGITFPVWDGIASFGRWLRKMEYTMELKKVKEDDRLRLCLICLDGEPYSFAFRKRPKSYEEFVGLFKGRYCKTPVEARRALYDLRQSSNIVSHVEIFLDLVEQVPDLKEEELFWTFRNSIDTDLKNLLDEKDIKKLEDAIDLVTTAKRKPKFVETSKHELQKRPSIKKETTISRLSLLSDEPRDLPCVEVLLDGKKTTAVIDTAATDNFVRGTGDYSKKKEITLGDGSKLLTDVSYLDKVVKTPDGAEADVSFQAVPNLYADAVLGMPWLSDCSIDLASGTITRTFDDYETMTLPIVFGLEHSRAVKRYDDS